MEYTDTSAIISECGQYRYALRREWGLFPNPKDRPFLYYVMLNPSTANGNEDDPTIRKCVGFSARNGFSGIVVMNLYAYRSTDPKALNYCVIDPVGPENNFYLWSILPESTVVCAWGAGFPYSLNMHIERANAVINILINNRCILKCLKKTSDGRPYHPARLPYGDLLEF